MKPYAAALFGFVLLALGGLTLASLAALDAASAAPALEEALALAEAGDEDGLRRLVSAQLVFGERARVAWLFAVAGVGGVSLAGMAALLALGWWKAVRPLARFSRQLASENLADLDCRGAFAEVRALAQAVNRSRAELREREREEVARYVVHQLKNLWTPVALVAHSLGPENAEAAALLEAQVSRARALLRAFQGLYQFPSPAPETVVWAEAIPRWLEGVGVPYRLEVADPSAASAADPLLVSQALENLARNAWEAQGLAGPPVEIVVEPRGLGVLDRGCGLGGGKPKGFGLGLRFCERVARAHGWELVLRDRPGGGAEAWLRWEPWS